MGCCSAEHSVYSIACTDVACGLFNMTMYESPINSVEKCSPYGQNTYTYTLDADTATDTDVDAVLKLLILILMLLVVVILELLLISQLYEIVTVGWSVLFINVMQQIVNFLLFFPLNSGGGKVNYHINGKERTFTRNHPKHCTAEYNGKNLSFSFKYVVRKKNIKNSFVV